MQGIVGILDYTMSERTQAKLHHGSVVENLKATRGKEVRDMFPDLLTIFFLIFCSHKKSCLKFVLYNEHYFSGLSMNHTYGETSIKRTPKTLHTFYKPSLSGSWPLLSAHLGRSQGCPFNRGFTVNSITFQARKINI